MNKSINKLLACTLSATMVLGSAVTVFAADDDNSTTGIITVENDKSEGPSYSNVVLPTVSDVSYDFQVDPNGLLQKYDPDNYETGTLYFESTKTPAQLTAKTDLYVKEKGVSSITDLNTALTSADGTALTFESNFYVWVPAGSEGEGEYLKLVQSVTEGEAEAAVTDYFNVDIDTENSNKVTVSARDGAALAGANPFDGNVYTDVYTTKIAKDTIVDAEKYGSYTTDDGFTDDDSILYADDQGKVAAIEDTNYTITEPVVNHNANSDAIEIVNKSTKKTSVQVDVEVSGIESLKFASSQTLGDNDLYLAVTDGKNYKYASVADGEKVAKISYTTKLDAATNSTLVYQTDDYQDKNGSHVYKQYETPGTTYDSAKITLTGASNKNGAWAKYLEDLDGDTETNSIGVKVTYTLEEVTTTAPSIETTSKKLASNSSTVSFDVDPGDATDLGVESVVTKSTGTKIAAYSFSNNKLTFNSTFAKNNYASIPSGGLVLTVTFNDADETAIDITITK
jgi:hypothetical protein